MRWKRKGWLWLLGGALAVAIALLVLAVNQPAAPVEVTFLGYTNVTGEGLAMFAIVNHDKAEKRGVVFTESAIGSGWQFDNRSNLQAVLQASGQTLADGPRYGIWIGDGRGLSGKSVIAVPTSAAGNKWRLVVQFHPPASRWRTTREKAAAFLTRYGAERAGKWVQPRPEKFYGPAMTREAEQDTLRK